MILRLIIIFGLCMVIRTIKTVQKINEISGQKTITAILIGLDTTLFLLVFNNLLSGDLNAYLVLSMALGYIAGYYLGAYIEEKMALGQVEVTIKISKEDSKELFKVLKANGFIFTRSQRVYSHKNKPRKIYQGIIYRKELPKLKKILEEFSFIAYVEPIKSIFGKKIVSSDEYLKTIK